MKKNKTILFALYIFLGFLISCNPKSNPKPTEYFRITFPEKKYQKYESDCPYTFEYPVYAKIITDTDPNTQPCWININFPELKAKIHITYLKINSNFNEILEDSHTLAYKHTVKADAIDEKFFQNDSLRVYGLLYDIKGNAASSIQFFLTDSTKNFLRGSLYFNVRPNKDSLAPVIDFLKKDIIYMIESFNWK